MMDTFCRITRCITDEGGGPRLTEIRVAGYYADGTSKEQITACCGKSIPYRAKNQKNAAAKAA